MINNTLVYFENKETFEEALNSGEISNRSIVFIKEAGAIWTHGEYYNEYEKVKQVLFESGPGSLTDAIRNLRNSILGKVSEDYNTLEKIESFLINPTGFEIGPGIKVYTRPDKKSEISVNIDNESLVINEDGQIQVNVIDGGEY